MDELAQERGIAISTLHGMIQRGEFSMNKPGTPDGTRKLKRAVRNHKRRVLRCKHSEQYGIGPNYGGYNIKFQWCMQCGAIKVVAKGGGTRWLFPKNRYALYDRGYKDHARLMKAMREK